jgi:hypothetical protein
LILRFVETNALGKKSGPERAVHLTQYFNSQHNRKAPPGRSREVISETGTPTVTCKQHDQQRER